MKKLIVGLLMLTSINSFAETIACTQGDRPISVKIEITSGQARSKMTVINYGETIYSGNAVLKKKPGIINGETVYVSTARAEGTFTNGPLPSWTLTFDGKSHAYLEILSPSLSSKLSMFETNERLYCK